MNPVIPPKRNRKEQQEYDKALYKIRHLVENTFLYLKRWRGIATIYAKNTAFFWPQFISGVFSFGHQSRDYTTSYSLHFVSDQLPRVLGSWEWSRILDEDK